MMIYGSLQTEFMGTKHNGHIHKYMSLVTLLFMYLNLLTMMINYCGVRETVFE